MTNGDKTAATNGLTNDDSFSLKFGGCERFASPLYHDLTELPYNKRVAAFKSFDPTQKYLLNALILLASDNQEIIVLWLQKLAFTSTQQYPHLMNLLIIA